MLGINIFILSHCTYSTNFQIYQCPCYHFQYMHKYNGNTMELFGVKQMHKHAAARKRKGSYIPLLARTMLTVKHTGRSVKQKPTTESNKKTKKKKQKKNRTLRRRGAYEQRACCVYEHTTMLNNIQNKKKRIDLNYIHIESIQWPIGDDSYEYSCSRKRYCKWYGKTDHVCKTRKPKQNNYNWIK